MNNPSFNSLLPPILAIILGFVSKQVYISLLAGIWLGAFLLHDGSVFSAFFKSFDTYLLNALGDGDHAAILISTLFIGAISSLIQYNGGTKAMVDWISSKAKGAKSIQLSTWFLGLCIFFDDYANSLILGKTMRPLYDKYKISREKLAFIVDATSAPIASIALVSTWISTEVGLIGDALKDMHFESPVSAYQMFISSLPYRFYPLLMIFFVFYTIYKGKDLWTMAKYSKLSDSPIDISTRIDTGKENATNNASSSMFAIVPLLFLIVSCLTSLFITGYQSLGQGHGLSGISFIQEALGNANAYKSLIWGTSLSLVFTILFSLFGKTLNTEKSMQAIMNGFESMLPACVILVLAWALAQVTKDLKSAEYILQLLQGKISPYFIPAMTFLTAAIVSFATGTSYGTMAIIMPISAPLAYSIASESGISAADIQMLVTASIGSVLAGSIFGDHCSPISDTTVMSSSSSECNLMTHVQTQLPYALLVALVGLLVGESALILGFSPFISLLLGAVILIATVNIFGKPNASDPA